MPEILIGFDYGTRKIGIAVGQSLTGTANPLKTIKQGDWLAIDALIQEWQPHALVVGIPFQLKKEQKNIAQQAEKFAQQLQKRYDLTVHRVDESLTSREAWRRIGGKAIHAPEQIDALAAKLILETWFNP